ncbi:hypothetical protein GcC1_175039 [Golovinomyces cichoracearum]|uniref:Retroviral polymerase SH3-like domain-containing protein n=1 Tax=Golovinomyces cichoracearum TaxID=62708 RepID=A0A420HPT2_9PEZI|nr:hypothetical protein GcC1_175039 [Golovinomyces cichoracearum]
MMQERANIGYLLGYASTNIFYVWISELDKVIRTRDVVFKDEIFDPLHDITMGQLRIEIPEEITDLDTDPNISASVPVFQVAESSTFENENKSKKLSEYQHNVYPTPSQTVSREQTQDLDDANYDTFSEGALDSFDQINFASCIEYFGAFSAQLEVKPDNKPVPNTHRDILPPLPKTWAEVLKHPYKDQFLAATNLDKCR